MNSAPQAVGRTVPRLPSLNFAVSELELTEGSVATIDFTLSAPLATAIAIPVLASGTALVGSDFSYNGVVTTPEGSTTGNLSYPVSQDNAAHSYRFFTIGTDQKANREGGPGQLDGDPGANADRIVSEISVTAVSAAQLIDFDINGGLENRSAIKQIDVVFNDQDFLADLLTSLNDADPTNDRIRLERKDLAGNAVSGPS